MEAGTVPQSKPADAEGQREETQAAAVEAFARDHDELTATNERDALDWLLGNQRPMEHYVDVRYDTPEGEQPLRLHIRAQDGKKLDAIEVAHTNQQTGVTDIAAVQADIVALACFRLGAGPGFAHEMSLASEEFRTVDMPDRDSEEPGATKKVLLASPPEALRYRFRTQWGLMQGVAIQVRRISGYDPEKIGQAQRRLVDAAGNS